MKPTLTAYLTLLRSTVAVIDDKFYYFKIIKYIKPSFKYNISSRDSRPGCKAKAFHRKHTRSDV